MAQNNPKSIKSSKPLPVRGNLSFKQLLSIAFKSWTYEQCLFILTDKSQTVRKVAQYVIEHKYIVGPKEEIYADLVDA